MLLSSFALATSLTSALYSVSIPSLSAYVSTHSSASFICVTRFVLSTCVLVAYTGVSVFVYVHVFPVKDVTVISTLPAIPVISDVCVPVPVLPSFTITL